MEHCLPADRNSLALRLDPVRRRSRVRKGWKTPQRRAVRALAAAVELLCKDQSEELIEGRIPHQPLECIKGSGDKAASLKVASFCGRCDTKRSFSPTERLRDA